jgi:hypothetical protein
VEGVCECVEKDRCVVVVKVDTHTTVFVPFTTKRDRE